MTLLSKEILAKNLPHWLEYLWAVTNPRVVKEGCLYSIGSNPDKKDFLNFYSERTGFVEFWDNGYTFIINNYPDEMKDVRRVAVKKKDIVPVDLGEIKIDNSIPVKKSSNYEIPSFGSRPDMSLKIMIDSGLKPSDELVEKARLYEESKNKPKEEKLIDEF